MHWANFLHIYQPSSQTPDILKRVTEESYRKIPQEVEASGGKLTINITGGLTELLANSGYMDVIEAYKRLLESGQIELTDSAMYHPFLPKLPDHEILRQIELNHAINRKYFGEAYAPKGFFVPEMVYTPKLGKLIASLGYEWMLVDEASYPGMFTPSDTVYESADIPGLKLFFRHRNSSFKILSAQIASVEDFKSDPDFFANTSNFVVTGMDGETFGHHRYGLEKLLGQLLKALPTATLSELLTLYPKRDPIHAQDGTWALLSMDEVRQAPFSRWYSPDNEIHVLQWQLVDLAIKIVNAHPADAKARIILDKSLHSDQFWWASAKPWWNIDMIGEGATELLDAILACSHVSETDGRQAEVLFRDILRTAWHWRASGKVDELVSAHNDEEARYRMDSGLTGMPKERIDKLLADLQNQLDMAVAATEYNRAADFKHRIAELEAERKNVFG